MKLWLAITVLLFLFDPGTIGKVNALKSEAKEAFKSGDFKTAIAKYRYLIDSLGVREDEVTMNLAHAYFQLQDTLQAANTYQPMSASTDAHIKSLANQQLGVLANRQGKYEEALQYFKQALKASPANEDARFNYEMVKKKLEDKKKQEQQNQDKDKKDQKDNKDQKKDQKDQQDKKDEQNKDQKKQDQKNQDQKDKEKQEQKDQEQQKKEQQEKEKKEKQKAEQEKENQKKDQKEIPPSVSEKLKDMQMSEEKAKMILEAMKNQEMQYLQQNKRKAQKPKDKGKPDW